MLDQFAGADGVGGLFGRWTAVGKELSELERSEQEKLRMLDLWSFQKSEIEAAALQPGEDTALEQERRLLMNLGRIQESAGSAFAALYDSPESALTLLRSAAKKVDEIARIDASASAIRETLEPAVIAIQEASYALRDYLDKLEANPARLEQLEERLSALDKLKRKYGATIEEVIAFLHRVREQIAAVENAGERMAELRNEQAELA